jgi:hypothetical protein
LPLDINELLTAVPKGQTLPKESAHNPYSRVLEGHHLSIRRSSLRADRVRKSPETVEAVGWLIRNAIRPGFPQGELTQKEKRTKKEKGKPVETGAAMEIDKGSLRQFSLDDFHRCLEKPSPKPLRLSHSYHRPGGDGH